MSLLAAMRRMAQLLVIELTSGTPSHKGTSRGGAQSVCMASARAVRAHRVVRASKPSGSEWHAKGDMAGAMGRSGDCCCGKAQRAGSSPG